MRGAVRSLCAVGAAALALSGPFAPPSGADPIDAARFSATAARFQEWGAAEEQAFVDKINQLRASLGLATLAIDVELTTQARVWSQTMKDAGSIFHTTKLDAGISADWEKLGENVGVGGTVDALFDAFVASPKHYENLVDPSYRFIGIGVVWDGTRMFTAHRFMALMPPAPPVDASPAPVRTPDAPPDTVPEELAATEAPTTTAPPAPAPVIPPASPDQIALILELVGDVFDGHPAA